MDIITHFYDSFVAGGKGPCSNKQSVTTFLPAREVQCLEEEHLLQILRRVWSELSAASLGEGTTCLWFHPKSVTTLLFSSTLPRPVCPVAAPSLGPARILCSGRAPLRQGCVCSARPLSSPPSSQVLCLWAARSRVSLTLVWT